MIVDVSETRNGRIMEYFRVRVEEAPVVRMVNLSNNVQYQLASDQFDEHSLSEFCLSYLEGKAKVSVVYSYVVYLYAVIQLILWCVD